MNSYSVFHEKEVNDNRTSRKRVTTGALDGDLLLLGLTKTMFRGVRRSIVHRKQCFDDKLTNDHRLIGKRMSSDIVTVIVLRLRENFCSNTKLIVFTQKCSDSHYKK